jgi:hypothetical protein
MKKLLTTTCNSTAQNKNADSTKKVMNGFSHHRKQGSFKYGLLYSLIAKEYHRE